MNHATSDFDSFSRRLEAGGIIAILRGVPEDALLPLAHTLLEADITLIEVALSVPGAAEQLRRLAVDLGDHALVGAGTVTSTQRAEAAAGAGARFLVTPHVVPEVNAFGREHGLPVVGGALTPTEIAAAREQGNAYVKIFPAAALGPDYLSALAGPYPDARLVAVGGVDADNAASFIAAGAVGVGVGSALTRAANQGGVGGASAAQALAASVRQAKATAAGSRAASGEGQR